MVSGQYMLDELSKCTNEKSPLTQLSISSIFLHFPSFGREYLKTPYTMRAGAVSILFSAASARAQNGAQYVVDAQWVPVDSMDQSFKLIALKPRPPPSSLHSPEDSLLLLLPHPHGMTKSNITEEARGHKNAHLDKSIISGASCPKVDMLC